MVLDQICSVSVRILMKITGVGWNGGVVVEKEEWMVERKDQAVGEEDQ